MLCKELCFPDSTVSQLRSRVVHGTVSCEKPHFSGGSRHDNACRTARVQFPANDFVPDSVALQDNEQFAPTNGATYVFLTYYARFTPPDVTGDKIMSDSSHQEMLARIAELSDTTKAAATQDTTPTSDPPSSESKLTELLQRVNRLTQRAASGTPQSTGSGLPARTPVTHQRTLETPDGTFIPAEPKTFREARLTESEVESLILKYLLNRGDASGHSIAEQVKLPFALVEPLLYQMKTDRLVTHKGAASMNDYVYQCTDIGRERGRRLWEHCTYFGSAPVALEEYITSVEAQTIQEQHPTVEDLKRAFKDLLIEPTMLRRLGPAINSGRGLFLFGAPGNGKTSIAERVTAAFGETLWIPRAIGIDGEIIRLFDPANHQAVPLEKSHGLVEGVKADKRWIRIRRPTIVVGGELTMDNLEITLNTTTNISEAPMQLKSNCGTLVIDDFGRQRMSTDELLNRWIVPLEKRYDFLNLANGKKIQVPFDQLIIFSTNLEPKDLVDDAFLRRIPYKIEVVDPSEDAFRKLFEIMCPIVGIPYRQEAIDHLIEKHYKATGRPFRCCQPRDLLMQIRNHCFYQKTEPELTNENLDFACENYFAVM